MNHLAGCRDAELLCRQRAAVDAQHSWGSGSAKQNAGKG